MSYQKKYPITPSASKSYRQHTHDITASAYSLAAVLFIQEMLNSTAIYKRLLKRKEIITLPKILKKMSVLLLIFYFNIQVYRFLQQ